MTKLLKIVPTETRQTTTLSDRSLSAFLMARGHEVQYFPRPTGHLDFEFYLTIELQADIQAFNLNTPIPVISFLIAQRQLTDAIRDHRYRCAGRK